MKEPRQEGAAQWARSCCGMDLCGDRPVIVKASRRGGGLSYSNIEPGDPALAAAAGVAVTAGCLSERESFTRWLTAPFPSVRKALQVFPSLLDIQLPFPLESCAYVFLSPARSEEHTVLALAVAARSVEITKKMEAYKANGMDPVLLDQEGLALWTQSLRESPLPENAARALVCLYDERATVAIGRNGRFVSSHSVRRAADEISRVLCSVFENPPDPMEWAWAGPGAADSAAVSALHSALAPKWPGKSIVHDDPARLLARALATRALAPGPLRCNLRTGVFEHALLTARSRKRSLTTAAIFIIAGVLSAAASLSMDAMAGRKLDSARKQMSSRADRLAGYRVGAKGADAIAVVQQAVDRQSELAMPFVESFDPSPAAALNTILGCADANTLRFQRLTLQKDSVTIAGSAQKWQQCDKLVACLEGLGFRVKLGRETSADGRISFSIAPGNKQ